MKEFNHKASIVMDFLKERGFKNHTIQCYEVFYQKLSAYLLETGKNYDPELGLALVSDNGSSFLKPGKHWAEKACIAKLNAVYTYGRITNVQISPRKNYSSLILNETFRELVTSYLFSRKGDFKESQIENARRRCVLFLKYIQAKGFCKVSDITYDDIRSYHDELSHLKEISRIIEESSIHQFLLYLAESGFVSYGLYLYLYALETKTLVTIDDFTSESRHKIRDLCDQGSLIRPDEFLDMGFKLLSMHEDAGYVPDYTETCRRAILLLYLFLDLHKLGYSPEIADIWLHSDAVRAVIKGSSWKAARRILFLFSRLALSGNADFDIVKPKGIKGLEELPDWCVPPILEFSESRRRIKLDEKTVKDDIYRIIRFCRFMVSKGLSSYGELSGEDVAEFNLTDRHGSPGAKNSCNGGVRRFLKFLYREDIISSASLYMALGYAAAPVETTIVTLTPEETASVKMFIDNACTDLEIRDSAVMVLGLEMGMRGSDIADLKLSDIDWEQRAIRFCQNKTDTDAWIPMPVMVGNTVFRYLSRSRPRNTGRDHVFIDFDAPHRPMTRCICYNALKRILPGRKVSGSGFHVTRKTFSTNRIRNGVRPEQIADVMGHRGTKSLSHYLSLDDERMGLCPLSLNELCIQMEGRLL